MLWRRFLNVLRQWRRKRAARRLGR